MKRRIFFTALTLAFTGAVAPGPMLALVASQVMAAGAWAVVPVLLGHALIEPLFHGLVGDGRQWTTGGLGREANQRLYSFHGRP